MQREGRNGGSAGSGLGGGECGQRSHSDPGLSAGGGDGGDGDDGGVGGWG